MDYIDIALENAFLLDNNEYDKKFNNELKKNIESSELKFYNAGY